MTSVTIPTGGTTGHSHEHSAAVEEAAIWLADQKEPPRLAVPVLRSQFGLSADGPILSRAPILSSRARDIC